MLFSVRGML